MHHAQIISKAFWKSGCLTVSVQCILYIRFLIMIFHVLPINPQRMEHIRVSRWHKRHEQLAFPQNVTVRRRLSTKAAFMSELYSLWSSINIACFQNVSSLIDVRSTETKKTLEYENQAKKEVFWSENGTKKRCKSLVSKEKKDFFKKNWAWWHESSVLV